MKTCCCILQTAFAAFLFGGTASAQVLWEAFNDHRAGLDTSFNATSWEMRGTASGGALNDIATGLPLAATMMIEEEFVSGDGASDDFGANATPNPGSPADAFFTGKCTIGTGPSGDNSGIVGIRDLEGEVVRIVLSNLDPTKRYRFRGTVCRGNFYLDRWAIFKITGADSATAAHTDASIDQNLFTAATFPAAGIQADEVALNSGDNLAGSMIGWDEINPGADGTFAIEGRQFVGTAPFGTPSAGPYGYGLNVMYLAEVEPGGGGVGTITNVSTAAGQITVEWTGPGVLQTSDNLTGWADILGAISPYSTPTTPARKFFRLRE